MLTFFCGFGTCLELRKALLLPERQYCTHSGLNTDDIPTAGEGELKPSAMRDNPPDSAEFLAAESARIGPLALASSKHTPRP
jgi:hypothetical protein